MPSGERNFDRSARRAARLRVTIGQEIRDARLAAGISQNVVARAARVSQPKISRLEAGSLTTASIDTLVMVADAVGLDLSVRAYPGRAPTRDAAHARKLSAFLGHVARPLTYSTEVALPHRDGVPEQRAWDAMVFAPDGDTGVELEMRLYDMQSQMRRLLLKWRDSGAERLLLLINDTRPNRNVLRTFPEYLVDLPRLRTSQVHAFLERGERPDSGYVLI
jgi:transcriptional regulator with XRE-family HTH domain